MHRIDGRVHVRQRVRAAAGLQQALHRNKASVAARCSTQPLCGSRTHSALELFSKQTAKEAQSRADLIKGLHAHAEARHALVHVGTQPLRIERSGVRLH